MEIKSHNLLSASKRPRRVVDVISSKSSEGLRTRRAVGVNPSLKVEDLCPISIVKQEKKNKKQKREREKFFLPPRSVVVQT